jgi:hypothetical protein
VRKHELKKLTAIGALLTCGWLALGTLAFVGWQSAETPGLPLARMLWPAFEAALLTALIFWVLAGIIYGVVRWIVTGRGPQA